MLLAQKLLAAGGIGLRFVGGLAGSANVSTTVTVNLTGLTGGWGTTPAKDDLVVLCWGFGANSDASMSVSTSGYTEACELASQSTGSAYANMAVAYKRMGASPDASVTFSSSGSSGQPTTYAIHVWRAVNAATPIDVAVATALGNGTGRPNAPSVTPVTSGAIVLACGTGTGGYTTAALTAPIGMGNLQASGSANATGIGSTTAIASARVFSGSSLDPAEFGGGSTSSSRAWAAATIALRPA